jgi:hypothetical protein
LLGKCARNSAKVNISKNNHPSAATAIPGVWESIWDPWYQAPYVRSSICSGNQIKASIGAEMSVTIKNPWGIQHARTYAAATTRRDKARESVTTVLSTEFIQQTARHNATPHILKKYGRDISMIPTVTSKKVLETKYGKIINTRPQISGTTVLCFLP